MRRRLRHHHAGLQQGGDGLRQALEVATALGQISRVRRRLAGADAAQQVASDRLEHAAAVAERQRLEALPTLQRMRGQDAMAETMQGADRCAVELGERRQQVRPVGLASARRRRPALANPGAHGILRIRVADRRGQRRLRPAQRLLHALPQACPELLRGRLGEGAHHDLLRQRARAFLGVIEQQTEVERGDRPGLAGAGAGVDLKSALQRRRGPVEGGAHASSSPAPFAPASLGRHVARVMASARKAARDSLPACRCQSRPSRAA